ncbi:MAG: MerR family DNA-binding transcriptional regulator, partial [Chloroflexi bacterium]|nr:MerR family DNA-binding transcriptional regulator [Chloroflexota bacterium]
MNTGPHPYRIGELAARVGVSVRTLHHYDRLGLVQPSARSEAGYRLYG